MATVYPGFPHHWFKSSIGDETRNTHILSPASLHPWPRVLARDSQVAEHVVYYCYSYPAVAYPFFCPTLFRI